MDKFLESFQARPTPQKIAIISGGAIILLLFLGLSFIVTNPAKEKVATQAVNPTPIPTVVPRFPTGTTTSLFENWQIYRGQNFDLVYPPDWLAISQVKDGVEMLKTAATQSSMITYPSIAIYDYFAKDPLFDNLQGQFLAEGFVKTLGKVNGYDAQYFTGNIPMQDGKNKTQQTNILVDLGSKKVMIKYTYLSNSVDNVLEDYLKKIFSTISFH